MLIRVDHAKMKATAELLSVTAENLRKSIERMKQEIAPLQKNWFVSGSPTGIKVKNSQDAVDEAMHVINSQLIATSTTVQVHSSRLAQGDQAIAGG